MRGGCGYKQYGELCSTNVAAVNSTVFIPENGSKKPRHNLYTPPYTRYHPTAQPGTLRTISANVGCGADRSASLNIQPNVSNARSGAGYPNSRTSGEAEFSVYNSLIENVK